MATDSKDQEVAQPTGITGDPFDQLIDINKTAFARSRYNTAYHTLSAALHWAEEDDNDARARVIETLAYTQLEWIDSHVPDYEHSSQSARLRGNSSIFKSLERRAHMLDMMMQRNRRYRAIGRMKRDADRA